MLCDLADAPSLGRGKEAAQELGEEASNARDPEAKVGIHPN